MPVEFRYHPSPTKELLSLLSNQFPRNPFYTAEYAEARKRLGWGVAALTLESGRSIATGCPVFTRRGRLHRLLEIHSLPPLPDPQSFWDGVIALGRRSGFTTISLNTSASRTAIPSLPGEVSRRKRCEYVLDLKPEDLLQSVSTNTARSIKRAAKEMVKMVRPSDAVAACRRHLQLVNDSMLRRKQRGENVSLEDDIGFYQSMLSTGAGQFFEAVRGEETLSSLLVLFAPKGAYYSSAGTSAAGMQSGSSAFLVYSIAKHLQEGGFEEFNLGGAGMDEESQGLRQFKLGFRSQPVELEAADFYVGSALRKKVVAFLTKLSRRRAGS